MKYTIHLMDLKTGEMRTITEDYPDDHCMNYNWTEGNWSCDCNRWREWLKAGGMSHAEAWDSPHMCGLPRIAAACNDGSEPFDELPTSDMLRLADWSDVCRERLAILDKADNGWDPDEAAWLRKEHEL